MHESPRRLQESVSAADIVARPRLRRPPRSDAGLLISPRYLQEGVPEADIVAELREGVDALRPVLAAAQERGFSLRGTAELPLSADAPTWADLYLLPPLADLAAIPERSVLDGALLT